MSLHLRTLLLALCCAAALGGGTRAPEPEHAARAAARQDVVRTSENAPQPFLAQAGALVDGVGGAALGSGPRPAPATRTRPTLPAPRLLHRGTHAPREFAIALRRARIAGLAGFGGTSPPPPHA